MYLGTLVTMSGTERRRDARYPARIVARVGRRNLMVDFLTNDVSFRGVFIRTDSPPALRQLVRVELVLPDKTLVSGHAMVVHITKAADGAPKGEGPVPGVGLQFWGPIEHTREWEQFIHGLKAAQKAGSSMAKATDKVRRASERFKLAVEVELDGMVAMTRDLSENGMAIRTNMAIPVGTRTELRLRTGDRVVAFDAVVRRAIDEPDFRGLGVELMEMTTEQHHDLVDLIRKNAPSEDRIFVPPGDPKLH